MYSLEDLADEILLAIIGNLELDNLTLSRVCRTSSRLNNLARTILYKSISFNLPPHEPFAQLAQSLDVDPELATLVRRLDLNWPIGGFVRTNDKVKMQKLLHKLTALQELSVRVPGDQRCTLSFLEFADYSELRKVTFNYPDLTNATILKFIFLPNIREMNICLLKSLVVPSIPLAHQPGTSPLKILRLGPCTPREVVLRKLLQCPNALETLDFSVPPFAEQFQTTTTTRDFSPVEYVRALEPVRHSLVNLSVYGRWIYRHDGSRLDLSTFEKLRNVSLPSNLLFRASQPHEKREGVHRLLPRSLESLEIVFPEPNWIFRFDYQMSEEDQMDKIPTKQKWISELASSKSTHFPLLERVILRESYRAQSSPLANMKLEIPEQLQTAFDGSNIFLRIWTRLSF